MFEQIVEQPSGTGIEDESYLIGENFIPLTKTLSQTGEITSLAALNAINGRQSGYDTYQNYADNSVLGAYRWLPGLRAGVISEVASSKALLDTTNLIATIFTVGISRDSSCHDRCLSNSPYDQHTHQIVGQYFRATISR